MTMTEMNTYNKTNTKSLPQNWPWSISTPQNCIALPCCSSSLNPLWSFRPAGPNRERWLQRTSVRHFAQKQKRCKQPQDGWRHLKRCSSGVAGSQLKCHCSNTKLCCQDSAAAAWAWAVGRWCSWSEFPRHPTSCTASPLFLSCILGPERPICQLLHACCTHQN